MNNKVRWDSSPVYTHEQLAPRERAANRGNILLAMHEQLLTDEDRGENTVTPPGGELGLNSTSALIIVAEDAIAAVLATVVDLEAGAHVRSLCYRAMKRAGVRTDSK